MHRSKHTTKYKVVFNRFYRADVGHLHKKISSAKMPAMYYLCPLKNHAVT